MIAVQNLACGVCIDKYGSLFVRLTLTQPSFPLLEEGFCA